MTVKVQIVGKFFDNHSLSVVNRNLALNLKDYFDVKITHIDNKEQTSLSKDIVDKLSSLVGEHEEADIELRHTYPPKWDWPKSNKTKLVYIQPWEFFSYPLEWSYKFDTLADAIITPSKWTKQVYESSGLNPDKVFAIPNGYDDSVFYNKNNRTYDKLKILFVGCEQFRKGLDVLLKVWLHTTKKDMDIELTVKDTPSVYGHTELLDKLVRMQYKFECAKIIYDDSEKTDEEMAELYNNHHIIVHPYRGEGFGMTVQEGMACGCIPIVTEGGPTDEFVNEFKISSHRKVVNYYEVFALKPEDSATHMGMHRYVLEPDIPSLMNQMKYVLDNHKDISVDTSKIQTWPEVTKQYVEVLNTIAQNSTKRVR